MQLHVDWYLRNIFFLFLLFLKQLNYLCYMEQIKFISDIMNLSLYYMNELLTHCILYSYMYDRSRGYISLKNYISFYILRYTGAIF